MPWGKQSRLQAGIRTGFRSVPSASAKADRNAGSQAGLPTPHGRLTPIPTILGRHRRLQAFRVSTRQAEACARVLLLALAVAPSAVAADLREADAIRWVVAQGGEVAADASSPGTRVNLGFTGANDGGLDLLRLIPNISSLDLSFAQITDIGMEQLKGLEQVRELNLFYVEHITDIAMAHLRGWKNLERLSLRGTDITDAGLQHVSSLSTLKSLDISFTLITNVGLEHLAKLNRLEELALGGNKISGSGLHVLKALPALVRLNLNGIQRRNTEYWSASVTDLDLDAIGSLSKLQELNLGGTKVTDLGLAKLKPLVEIRSLDLSRTQVSSVGLATLAAHDKLERLSLWKDQRVEDAGVAPLLALKNLHTLDLSETGITDQALERLATMTGLRRLYVDGTRVTAEGVERFGRENPRCEIRWK